MELREIYDFGKGVLITEKSKLPAYALAKLRYSFGKADTVNGNNRIYPESILVREIRRKNEELKRQKIAGMLEHPVDGFTKLDKTMHALSLLEYDSETKLAWGESFVLDTSGGRDFMTLLKSGLRIGASMRGTGNIGQDRRVQDDYKLISVDFVANPSFGADAVISQDNLIESANSLMLEEFGEQRRVLPKDVLFESFIAGCSASEFAKKINASIDRKEETIVLGFTQRELNFIMAEAMAAGFDISDAEKRKKYLEVCLRNKEAERAAEAKRLKEQQRAEEEKRLAEAKRKETLLSNVKKILEKNGDSPEVVKTLKKILEEV